MQLMRGKLSRSTGFVVTLKLLSRVPSELNLARKLDIPLIRKTPLAINLLSGCRIIEFTNADGVPVIGVSKPGSPLPSGLSLAIAVRASPRTEVKSDPSRILPSDNGRIAVTVPSIPDPASNDVSR